MKVLERFRAEIVIRLVVVLVLGVFAGSCRGVSEQAGDPDEASAYPETVDDDSSGTPPPLTDSPQVVFLGTSLTAGYGLDDHAAEAYPALIQSQIRARGLSYGVTNAGVSGDTSAGGLARMDWLLALPMAVLVVELGANDGLRGQSTEALHANLTEVVDRARAAHPSARIVIAGMEAPPNLGPEYTQAFRAVFTRVAESRDAALIPFLLEGVAGERSLNQADGIHPNSQGHQVVADNVWAVLEGTLLARCAADQACDPS